MNKNRKAAIEANEISEVKEFSLGGYPQKVMIEGKTRELPVVITLHGGPGFPLPFCVGARGMFSAITDHCILVCWDQYGSGINQAKLPKDISIDAFLAMTLDLIKEIKSLFPQNRIWLFGMSWGSVLSAMTAAKAPELIDGVMTYGQVLTPLLQSEETIETLMRSKAPKKLKAEITKALEEKTVDHRMAIKLSKAIRKYTTGYTNPEEPKGNTEEIVRGILSSPDYRFKDKMALFRNGYAKNTSLIKELSVLDLRNVIKSMSVPYHIFQGETDIVTCTKEIKEFVEKSGNPHLSCTVVEKCSHLPGENGMGRILEEIIRLHTD